MTQPRTKAGQRLLARERYNSRSFDLIRAEDIRAIEDEAVALDVERLERALIQTGLYIDDEIAPPKVLAEWLAREYANDEEPAA